MKTAEIIELLDTLKKGIEILKTENADLRKKLYYEKRISEYRNERMKAAEKHISNTSGGYYYSQASLTLKGSDLVNEGYQDWQSLLNKESEIYDITSQISQSLKSAERMGLIDKGDITEF
jgi:hypothetical protein